MEFIYFGTIFAATILFSLTEVLLFLQRKEGERSRIILAGIILVSIGNYISRMIHFYCAPVLFELMPVSLLLLGLFVITTYIMYPIEVISPGWLNRKRVMKIYFPLVALCLVYGLTLWLGVEYTVFCSTAELLHRIGTFEVIFRIVLALLIFVPVVLLCFVSYTRRYNNTNHTWMRIYVVAVVTNIVAFLLAINSDLMIVRVLYYLVSVSCVLCVVYQELFVRLIRRTLLEQNPIVDFEEFAELLIPSDLETDVATKASSRGVLLFGRLEQYMNSTKAWRNPDLRVVELTAALCTNRTSLREAIQLSGFSSYTAYVNGKRIEEFIEIVQQENGFNYQQVFYDVGFRHKTTALRNFKELTGMTPSDYFKKQAQQND